MNVRPLALLLCTSLLGCGLTAEALDLQNVIADYMVTSWSQKDGLPSGIVRALAQDRDGYLWIGSDAGLFRFDGVRFARIDGREGAAGARMPVRALCIARDGSLWVGFGGPGGVRRIQGGTSRNYDEHDGLPAVPVAALVEDQAGSMWAGTAAGLFQLDGDRWVHWDSRAGLPDGQVHSAYVDSRSNLMVGMDEGIFFRRGRAGRFELLERNKYPVGEQSLERQPRSIAEDWSGQLWESNRISGFRKLGEKPVSMSVADWGRGYGLLFDTNRNLWVATIGQGLWRVRESESPSTRTVERATSLTGLGSDGVFSLLEDKEGNIWVGTDEGLSRLTPRRVVQHTNLGIVVGLGATASGSVWVGTVDELIRFSPASERPSARIPLHGATLRAIHVDQDGTVWGASDQTVFRMTDDRHLVPLAGTDVLHQVDSLSSDGLDGVVISDRQRGLLRWSRGRLLPFGDAARIKSVRASVLHTDLAKRIWIAFDDGRLMLARADGSYRIFGKQDGLIAGVVRQIYEDDVGDIWLAASNGVLRFFDGRFVSAARQEELPAGDVTAVVTDHEGTLWVGMTSGVVHVSDAGAGTTADQRRRRYTVYDRSSGLAGSPVAYNSNLRVIRASDGGLWFVTSRGLSIIEPWTMRQPRPPGVARIEDVVVNDRQLEPRGHERLPAQTSRIEIHYTVVDLTAPFHTRFRYRLEGFDPDWIEADSRREAFYTNLPPRQYTFRVIATNTQADVEDVETQWAFSIAPKFYQTSWFYASLACGVSIVIWVAWQLRLRGMRRRFSMILGERARLSREVHDTLLQSLVGMALQFDAIASDGDPLSEQSRTRLGRMRKQVEEHIREARQSILALRSPRLERGDLVTALRDVGGQATAETPIRFDCTVSGDACLVPRKIEEQLLRVGQEAVLNAARHAKATEIIATLEYLPSAVALQVRDNGSGFESTRVGDRPSTHYGLVSMRERAEEVGGDLTITSVLGQGTRVRIVIPVERLRC